MESVWAKTDSLGQNPPCGAKGGAVRRIGREHRAMKRKIWLVGALMALLWAAPTKADTGIIIRTTAGLPALQTFCSLPLSSCTIIGTLDGTLGQVFLVTTPLNATTFISLLSNPIGGLVG